MKLLRTILAIYILLLTCLPCNDGHANLNRHSTQPVIESIDGAVSNTHQHQDACSPLCSCSCCQTLTTQPEFVSFLPMLPPLFKGQTAIGKTDILSQPHHFWQPPKILS